MAEEAHDLTRYPCPQCGAPLPADAPACTSCDATFDGPDSWKPIGSVPVRPPAPEEKALSELNILGYSALLFVWPFLLMEGGKTTEFEGFGLTMVLCIAYGALPIVAHVWSQAVHEKGKVRTARLIAVLPYLVVAVPILAFIAIGLVVETFRKWN